MVCVVVCAATCVCIWFSLFAQTDLDSQSEDVLAKWKLSSSKDVLWVRAQFLVHDGISVSCTC